ncbi:hypothetical protein, partial [Chryseobacterium sp. MOF25P]|uniref:hypothetical protein n=2 Tax=unclassified Chryseobacterium TaxID=2593645 RepID=UPI0012FC76D3
MKKYFKDYTEHLPAILLLFYLLGFTYQYTYYLYFNISIQYYITLTDVIFIAIENLIFTIVCFGLIEGALEIFTSLILSCIYKSKNTLKLNLSERNLLHRFKKYMDFLIDKNKDIYKFSIYILFFIVILIFSNEKFYIFSLIFPAFFYRCAMLIKKEQKPISEELKNGSYVMLFCMLLVFYAFWGLKEAKDIKNTYSSKIIRIDNMYTGDGENKFIGETSNYYFIFKTKSSTVSVYNKADLALVEVEPNKYRRKEIKDSDNDL